MTREYTHPDLRDNHARAGDPEFGPEAADFNTLPLVQRLDSIQRAIQRPMFKLTLVEALAESDEYPTWLNQLIDSSVSNEDIGRAAREIVCAYISEVARLKREEL